MAWKTSPVARLAPTLLTLAFLPVASLRGESAAPPVADPPAGTYSSGVAITLGSSTPGAKIYYTTDGTTPTRQSAVYKGTPLVAGNHVTGDNVPPGATSAPLTTVSMRLRAIAVSSGLEDSPVATTDYVIDRVDTAFDIAYVGDGDPMHRLDVYQPHGAGGTPVVFFVHGGAWIQGDKNIYFELANTFAGFYGLTTVVVNYRLSAPGGAAQHPDHMHDVAAAFAWVVEHIAAHGGDPTRIFAFGQSAGGHLVSLLATDPQYLAAHGLSTSALAGVVTMSGTYDLIDMVDFLRNPLSLTPADLAAYNVLLTSVFGGTSKPTLDAVSPQVQASSTEPPLLVIGIEESDGFVDMPGFHAEAENFYQHLTSLEPAPPVAMRWLTRDDIPPEVLAIDIPDFDYDGHYHEIYAINTRDWTSASTRLVTDFVSDAILRLQGNRFEASVQWINYTDGSTGLGHPAALSNESGSFWFFGSANVELIVKVLDGTAVNGQYWVMYGALSDVGYTILVRDTLTGRTKTYTNPAHHLASAADSAAFPATTSDGADHGPSTTRAELPEAAAAGCATAGSVLCLNGSRFAVTVDWVNYNDESTGSGTAAALTGDSGTFSFFSPSNIELVVKVLDGRAVNGHFWIMWGALSDVEYTITLTDTETGAVRAYHNPPHTLASGADVDAM